MRSVVVRVSAAGIRNLFQVARQRTENLNRCAISIGLSSYKELLQPTGLSFSAFVERVSLERLPAALRASAQLRAGGVECRNAVQLRVRARLMAGVGMKDQEPPKAPTIPAKIRLNRSEKMGLPFLFLLPVLAVAGAFGPATEVVEGQTSSVGWSAEYPSRLRFQNSERLNVRVQNRSQVTLAQVKLAFDPNYIHAFTTVAFDPAPSKSYEVELQNLAPGESRLVSVQLAAEQYGPHKGWIALSDGQEAARANLSTFIFP